MMGPRRHSRFLAHLCMGIAGGLLALTAQAQVMGKMAMPKLDLGSSAAFARDGSLVAVTKQGEHVMLYRSRDEGRYWDAPVAVNAAPEAISADGENRPKVAVTSEGAVLVSWTRPLSKPYSGEIRLARSEDGGARFDSPITVHRDRREITHRFESILTGSGNRVYLAWIDKRDLESAKTAHKPYRGAAIYLAMSDDGGRSFRPETKLADHSCECCRIASAPDAEGEPLFLWRHVFEPNERDHMLAKVSLGGTPVFTRRATFDRWKVDGCPHHGPSLAVAPTGVLHAVWFNQVNGVGRVFYGRLLEGGVEGQRTVGGERAAHADLALAGTGIAVSWKEFDGERTRLLAEISDDAGASFESREVSATDGASDQPRVLRHGDRLFVFWRTEHEGMRVFPLR